MKLYFVSWEGSTSLISVPLPRKVEGMVDGQGSLFHNKVCNCTDTGDPVTVPNVCWKNWSLVARYAALGQKGGSAGALWGRVRSSQQVIHRSVNSKVHWDTTSKDTRCVLGRS